MPSLFRCRQNNSLLTRGLISTVKMDQMATLNKQPSNSDGQTNGQITKAWWPSRCSLTGIDELVPSRPWGPKGGTVCNLQPVAGFSTQTRTDRLSINCWRGTLDGYACAPRSCDRHSVNSPQRCRASRVLALTLRVVRWTCFGVCERGGNVYEWVRRARYGRASDHSTVRRRRPGCSGGCGLREHEACGRRFCSSSSCERPGTACAGRTAGDIVGSIASAPRSVPTTDCGVSKCWTGIVPGGAVILTLQESKKIYRLVVGGRVV